MHPKVNVPLDKLKSRIEYDPETGKFTRIFRNKRLKTLNTRSAGELDANGYLRIQIFKRTIGAARVAWALTYGQWPELEVDHINGNRSDNRLCNLRLANRSQNMANQHTPRGKDGVPGVFKTKSGRWEACVYDGDTRMHLGRFKTQEEAELVRQIVHVQIHGSYSSGQAAITT